MIIATIMLIIFYYNLDRPELCSGRFFILRACLKIVGNEKEKIYTSTISGLYIFL